MNRLLQVLMKPISRKYSVNADERYLAQSVDAQAFEVRLQALERSRA
jgi:hypothetical protein